MSPVIQFHAAKVQLKSRKTVYFSSKITSFGFSPTKVSKTDKGKDK
jgi:hypothetical protein